MTILWLGKSIFIDFVWFLSLFWETCCSTQFPHVIVLSAKTLNCLFVSHIHLLFAAFNRHQLIRPVLHPANYSYKWKFGSLEQHAILNSNTFLKPFHIIYFQIQRHIMSINTHFCQCDDPIIFKIWPCVSYVGGSSQTLIIFSA